MSYFRVGSFLDKFSVEFTDGLGSGSWFTLFLFDTFEEADSFMRIYVANNSDCCDFFER